MTTNLDTKLDTAAGRRQRARNGLAVVAALATTVAFTMATSTGSSAQTAPTQRVGTVCNEGTRGTNSANFALDSAEGYISLPDGNTAYMWGYQTHGGTFQHPGPVLCVNEGDVVTVAFTNLLPAKKTLGQPLSIMFPGQENVLANGVPAQPELPATVASGGIPTASLTKSAATGATVTYSFVASHAGTYIYESGTDPQTQVRMGLFGALIVRPSHVTDPNPLTVVGGVKYAYDKAATAYMGNEDFLVLLSEIDPYQHQAIEGSGAKTSVLAATNWYKAKYNIANYHQRYWLINGRGFPDSIADNNASFLPTQPYGALARILPFNASTAVTGKAYHPYPGLARYINVGTEDYPFHPHGNNGAIIARDGHLLENAAGQDMSLEKFSINIGPGQTWDVLFKWFDAENYGTGPAPQKQVPVTVPNVASQTFGMFYSGSPYLGVTGTKPPGFSTQNQCGEFYIIAHNHALYQITSWGVNMTGPITYMRIDDPNSTNPNCG